MPVAMVKKRNHIKILKDITRSLGEDPSLEALSSRIAESVAQLVSADACLLYLLEEDGEYLVLKSSNRGLPPNAQDVKLKLGEGITGWVARERKPLALPQHAYQDPRFKLFPDLPEDRYEAFLSVPMISKNSLVGVINVQHMRPHFHEEEEIMLVGLLAQQVAGAVESARLHGQAHTQSVQLEALSQISSAVSSGKYLGDMLSLVVSVTAKVMGSRICSVMLINEKYRELNIAATQSLSDAYRSKPNIPLGAGISGKAAAQKKPIAVADVRSDPEYRFGDIARKEGLCSLLSVPMLIKDRAVGVINCYTSQYHHFTGEEIKMLQSIANQCAVAVENNLLQEKADSMEEQLEARKWVDRAKGILMKKSGLSEEEAYNLLRKKSMDIRKPLKEIAQVIVIAAQ